MTESQVSATKQDVQMLMDAIGKLYDANAGWKSEILDGTDKRISESEVRMKRYFDLTVEAIRHDLLGANKDRIENHEDRINRLERQAGLAAA